MAAPLHHGATAFVGNDLQTELGEFQRAHDFRTQQAAHVGAVRVGKVLIELAAHGRAADERVALEHLHLEAGAGQIAGRHQSVVAGADDDGVQAHWPGARAGASPATPACSVASTAISNAFKVSARHDASCAAETNHGSRESGSHRMPSSCSTWAMAS